MTTLTDALTNALTAAEAAANAALTDAKGKMDAAVAATPTEAGDCLEGMILMDDAWSAVATAFDAAGRAESLRDIVDLGTLTGGTLTIPPANVDLTSLSTLAATKATQATTHANDARVYVLTREQLVRDKFKDCVSEGIIGPLLNLAQACVTASIAALNGAVTNLADPGPPPGSSPLPNASLQSMVNNIIDRAAGLGVPADTAGDGLACNVGVAQLAKALALINDAKEKASALTTCLGELNAVAPADPLINQGQSALSAAQTQIINAKNQLDNDASIAGIWMNRANCLLKEGQIIVKVRDESGDEIGKGVNVSVVNPVIAALLPVPTTVPFPTECPGSQLTFPSVPLAAVPVALPAGTPPKPPGIPDLPSTATLVFNVARGGGRTFSASVDPNGFLAGSSRTTITLQLDEVSSLTSC
jgi:hypothetical protein